MVQLNIAGALATIFVQSRIQTSISRYTSYEADAETTKPPWQDLVNYEKYGILSIYN